MHLIDLIRDNNKLKYLDALSGKEYSINQLIDFSFSTGDTKKLTFLYVDNSIKSISVFWTFFNCNCCIALLNPQLKTALKENLENIYKPNYIFDLTRNQINGYKPVSACNNVIFTNSVDENLKLNENLKLLLSTSGTTGSPKFVKLSESNIIQNALSIKEYLPIQNSDITPLNLPFYYSYGLSVLTTNSLAGGKIVSTSSDIITRNFWEELNNYGYTSFAGVPFVYEMLNRIGFLKKSYPSLRYFTQAGGKLNETLAKSFAEYAIHEQKLFYIMYGQTEATARMSYLSPNDILHKLGSIGKPIKNGTFIINNENNELLYKGPNVFGGYAENLEDLKTFNQDDILKTGDIARVDEDGFYFITGRLKRFTKIFGVRINLDEVENILKNNFSGLSFACTGINDKILFIGYLNESIEPTLLRNFIKNELNIHPSVIKVELLKSFPLTSNGKINYNQIQVEYGNS
jgi:long-chain acyl-CoA synthetase